MSTFAPETLLMAGEEEATCYYVEVNKSDRRMSH